MKQLWPSRSRARTARAPRAWILGSACALALALACENGSTNDCPVLVFPADTELEGLDYAEWEFNQLEASGTDTVAVTLATGIFRLDAATREYCWDAMLPASREDDWNYLIQVWLRRDDGGPTGTRIWAMCDLENDESFCQDRIDFFTGELPDVYLFPL